MTAGDAVHCVNDLFIVNCLCHERSVAHIKKTGNPERVCRFLFYAISRGVLLLSFRYVGASDFEEYRFSEYVGLVV
ncbi:MAG: hypothetical protein BWY20_01330 [Spirochaetes bacterium ADurb.Bin215]|nr:MAG: hypothetical protein BWY20_01330 [Spirochaetes bacterium ADurb.Bin215]